MLCRKSLSGCDGCEFHRIIRPSRGLSVIRSGPSIIRAGTMPALAESCLCVVTVLSYQIGGATALTSPASTLSFEVIIILETVAESRAGLAMPPQDRATRWPDQAP